MNAPDELRPGAAARPDPQCPACRGSGRIAYDTTHLGEASGWNPGIVTLRCECWPLDAASLAALNAFLAGV